MQIFNIGKGHNDYHLQNGPGSQEQIRFGARARSRPEEML